MTKITPRSKARNGSKPIDSAELIEELLAALPKGTVADQSFLSTRVFFEIAQQSPLAISITDNQANMLYVNPSFESLTGYDRAFVLGKNESLLSHKQTPVEIYQKLWATIQGKEAWRGTLVNRRKNGEAYLAELLISPVLDEQDEIAYFLGIHRDVTELNALERKVRNQKALLESILDSAPVIVSLLDAEHKVLLDNQAYKKLLGDLRGLEPAHLFLDSIQPTDHDARRPCTEGQDFEEIEVRLDIAGRVEPRWFSVSGTWVDELDCTAIGYFGDQTKGRCCLLLVANEITMLKRQLEQVRMQHLRASLSEQQRIQGMREALSGAIFQMQTPINVIQAAASVLERSGDGGRAGQVLNQALNSGREAMETLRAALPPELQERESSVNINALLQDVMTLMTGDFLAQGVTIEWHPQTIAPSIIGRANQLRSMLMRLLENALLAVTESGKPERIIRIVTRSKGDGLEVLIQDNGPGIAEASRLKIFEPFYTGWSRAKGHSGMGLSLVQDTVNQHGGVIDIGTNSLDGCIVRITFPVNEGKNEGLDRGDS
jgi:nitrogen fixation regulatory protein